MCVWGGAGAHPDGLLSRDANEERITVVACRPVAGYRAGLRIVALPHGFGIPFEVRHLLARAPPRLRSQHARTCAAIDAHRAVAIA